MQPIYKISSASLWEEATGAGVFRGAPVDLADGFIHFSTAEQLAGTAAKHFTGQRDLVLVAVDADALGPALRREPSRGGDLFPHLYGELPLSAVLWVQPISVGPDGTHRLPALADAPGGNGFDPGDAGWTRASWDRFVGLVGPLWMKGEGVERRYGFLAEARHLNRGGIVHGGMVMTFADQALGMTGSAVNRERRQVTVQLDTHFVGSVREGEFVEARCRVVRQTRSLLFLAGELTVGERVVATAQGVWKLLGDRREKASGARP